MSYQCQGLLLAASKTNQPKFLKHQKQNLHLQRKKQREREW